MPLLFCLSCEATAWATDLPMVFIRYLINFWSNKYRNKMKTKMNLVLFCIPWFWWLWWGIRSWSLFIQQRISLVLCCNDSLGHHESSLWWVTVWGCLFLTWQSRNKTCYHWMGTLFPFVSGCISFPSAERFSLLLPWYPHTQPWHISSLLTNILF